MNDRAAVFIRDICDDSKRLKLNDGTPLALGRNPESKITDTRCSRVQLLLTLNLKERHVLIEHTGNNLSAVNGIPFGKGEKRKAYHDDIIEVLSSNYFYKIEFPPVVDMLSSKSDSSPAQSVKTKLFNNGSLDHFLKDATSEPVGSWNKFDEDCFVVFTSKNVESKKKIASFDLDGTIITTISGNVFGRNPNDWKIAFDNVVVKLKELHENDYKIVVFTNQSGIGRGKVKLSDFKQKLEGITRKLNVPIQVFIATKDDIYRKPRPGMWRYLVEKGNDGVKVQIEQSFFCGDAAGRPANCEPNKKKKDFAVSDRLFAINLHLKFYTPEEYFLGWKTAPFQLPEFDPRSLLQSSLSLIEPPTSQLVSKSQEIVVMIGCPGSGKSFFSKKYLVSAGYAYVNRDTLKTWQKCVRVAEKSINEGLSVVVDNTNPDKESRARYTSIAKRFGIPVRAFWMKTSLVNAQHNNTFRQIKRDDSHDYIPNHSLQQFFNILEAPELAEGFSEIVRVNFVPRFENEKDKELYSLHLLD